MERAARSSILLLSSALFVAAGAARAQIPFDPYIAEQSRDPATAIKFNLSPPGARSLAMGGAFLALADDATAAYTNPAGLTNLALGGSEVAVEVRLARFTTSFTDRGHYNTTPGLPTFVTGIAQDSVDGLPPGEAESETSGLSFLSFGYVVPGGLTLAVYRHELANFRSAFESQGPFNDDFCFPQCSLFRVQPRRSALDLEIVNFGVSAAYALNINMGDLETSLSLGLGLSYYDMELEAASETFALCRVAGSFDPSDVDPGFEICADISERPEEQRVPGAFFGPADFSRDNFDFGTFETGDDQAFGFSLGFLWKLGKQQRWSIGGVFREGPEFETQRASQFSFEVEPFPEADGQVTVPDVFGLGLAFRTGGGRTKLALDVNRVRYSQTLTDFATTQCFEFDFDTLECVPGQEVEVAGFEIPDVTQVHLGLERTVLVVENLFVGTARLGAWHEPFHEPEYVGGNPDLEAILVRRGDDETHLALGLGLAIKEDYQIDFAVDYSDPVTTFSASLVKFF